MQRDYFRYTGSRRREISFPLGGIGTGSIGLGGDGRLVDWEIFNRPNKGGLNGFSHFAVRCEDAGGVLDARVLQTGLAPPYTGLYGRGRQKGFGFGPQRETLAGLPHFANAVFTGEYPVATLQFEDAGFPGSVCLTAFNPLIPNDEDASGIPAAFFEIAVENTQGQALDYTLAFTVGNPFAVDQALNEPLRRDGKAGIVLTGAGLEEDDLRYGSLAVMTDAEQTSHTTYWYRGRRFDGLELYWRSLTSPGSLPDRVYSRVPAGAFRDVPDSATLAAHLRLAPGESGRARFVLSWSFPNCANTWSPRGGEAPGRRQWRNHYATRFETAADSAAYALDNWDGLYRRTARFKQLLFSSGLPDEALDAVSANISILKSPACMRLEDGSFYGFEGCEEQVGSCEGSCTHVWNYAYALPFLFPRLERSMRELDYRYNQDEAGGMRFRLQLPLGSPLWDFAPCCDGQFGGVMKVWREWKLCGDDAWLKKLWPAVKRSVEYAWSAQNPHRWDPQQTGVLQGRQHHTLDMELFGPNAWLTGFYLAALACGAEMAARLGEEDTARLWRALYEKGKGWVDKNLFDGEYFAQAIDLQDRGILAPYRESPFPNDNVDAMYWNEEAGQLKYQVGEGCGIDQVTAQWHARLCGMPDVFDREKVRSALAAIYKYNFKKEMRGFANPCRIYSLNDEAGAVVCEWPPHARRAEVPLYYAQECMCGFEYQAAAHMVMEGMERQGLELVRAVRGRYDGEKRNPWNEIECGSNYARSMAAYSLLLAYSGFSFDMTRGHLGFAPACGQEGERQFFWSAGGAWGGYKQSAGEACLWLEEGALALASFTAGRAPARAALDGAEAAFRSEGATVYFDSALKLGPGSRLSLHFLKSGA